MYIISKTIFPSLPCFSVQLGGDEIIRVLLILLSRLVGVLISLDFRTRLEQFVELE